MNRTLHREDLEEGVNLSAVATFLLMRYDWFDDASVPQSEHTYYIQLVGNTTTATRSMW